MYSVGFLLLLTCENLTSSTQLKLEMILLATLQATSISFEEKKQKEEKNLSSIAWKQGYIGRFIYSQY